MRAICYARVSTEEQKTGGSLDYQKERCEAYCRIRGYEYEYIEDCGVSGKTIDRPGLQRALEKLSEGEAQCIVFLRLDRLTRNTADLGKIVDVSTKQGWEIVSLSENIDTTSAGGRFLLNVLVASAQYERELICERIKQGLKHKRDRNEKTGGLVPYGYSVRKRKGKKILVENPKEQEVIGQILELHKEGTGYNGIARVLNERGVSPRKAGKKWYPNQIRQIVLRNA